jgi:hypothetical protein
MVTSVAAPTPVITVKLPELYDPETGALDAQTMAEYLVIPLTRLAPALGRKYSTVHKSPAAALQPALFSFKRSLDMLADVFGERSMILAWLKSPLPDLDNRPPFDVMLDGYADAVEGMPANALAGIPS